MSRSRRSTSSASKRWRRKTPPCDERRPSAAAHRATTGHFGPRLRGRGTRRTPASRPALVRCRVDRGMGLHGCAGRRGLPPGWGRSGRPGRIRADGTVGTRRPAGEHAGRSFPARTRPDPVEPGTRRCHRRSHARARAGPFVVFRPAHSALLPALCGSPLELTSANLVRGLLDSLSTLLGPLVATVLLAFASPVAAFGATAWLALVAGVLLLRMPYEAPPAAPSVALPRTVRDIGAGFRGLWSSRDVRLLIGLALVQTFTRGCLNVFLVAIPLELFHTGAPGVGLITATVGIGAIAGSLGALALTGGRRLAAIEGAGVALWGLPLTLCGVMANQPAVLALFALIGVGNALVDVGLFTLPARLVPYELLARIFGAFESLVAVTVALGSLITPFVIGALGIRGALVVLGLPAPVLVALAWRRLHAIDGSLVHRDREVAVLRSVGVLAPLPMPTIDSLALHAASMEVAAGQEVFHQGDAGDSFYVIKAGEADVVGDGRLVRTLGAGDCFGEIALLRDTPRTASVRARTTLSLLSLSRPEFILAVGGFSASTREVDGLLRTRLTAFDPARSG
ncbi:MAG: MFS transporter [Chloroflexi bacterium]|nr:MAG: MFS transporter [Chloroflexota bacterium]